jgi:hypothetical protein
MSSPHQYGQNNNGFDTCEILEFSTLLPGNLQRDTQNLLLTAYVGWPLMFGRANSGMSRQRHAWQAGCVLLLCQDFINRKLTRKAAAQKKKEVETLENPGCGRGSLVTTETQCMESFR